MSRYSVNQKLPVVFLKRTPKNDEDVTCNLWFLGYSPMFDEQPPEIQVATLTVVSEHKVPWEFGDGDETPYDGYILTDEAGNTWHNQYPAASYGQLSDAANGVFDLALETKASVEQFLIDHPYGCGEGILATRYLDTLDRTLKNISEHSDNPDAAEKYEQLREHYDGVLKALEAAQLPVAREPLTMGGKVIDGMFRHKLMSEQAA